jgi:hypothetical protein
MRIASLCFVMALTSTACGGKSGESEPPLAIDDAGVDVGADGDLDATFNFDTPSGCTAGSTCGDAGVCTADGTCCERALACGSVCCPSGNVCSFGKCAVPGGICVDATDCKPDEICDYALGPAPTGDAGMGDGSSTCTGGVELKKGRCLPRPPRCSAPGGDAGVDSGSGDEITCLDKCEYRPPIGKFEPKLKFSWGNPAATNTQDSVMMTPIVVQLDDDNCDGVVDERDIPEIVFTTFASGQYNADGTLHAISIVDKKVVEKWKIATSGGDSIWPGASLAAGNIDGKPGNEIVTCLRGTGYKVRAYDSKGGVLWTSIAVASCRVPSIADLDGDGKPEVIVESDVLDGATGAIKFTLPSANGETTVADVDGDGVPEIISPTKIWSNTGTLLADAMATTVTNALPGGSYVAVGDFDKDGIPEIVAADSARHQLHVWRYDAALPSKVRVLRRGLDINGTLSPSLCPIGSAGNTRGGGPPTIADFNGDGTPDVAMAGGIAYGVYDGKKLLDPTVTNPVLWLKQTHDCSSAVTGSSVFDFDGDGRAEVVYSDEWYLRIYSGLDGTVLFQTCNTTGTLQEYPVVADVDNDGHADIIVASNSYSSITCPTGGVKTAGIRVFGDTEGKWVRTRRIWNQHTYHVTNVLEDGTIPKNELPNWKQPRLNNFRQNVQPLGEFAAPDLIVNVRPSCEGVYALVARVRNIGEAAVEAPIDVGLYAGTTLLGKMTTTRTLYPAEAEDLVFTFAMPPAGVSDGTIKVHAIVDDGMPMHPWHECRTDNNKSPEVSGRCAGPK